MALFRFGRAKSRWSWDALQQKVTFISKKTRFNLKGIKKYFGKKIPEH